MTLQDQTKAIAELEFSTLVPFCISKSDYSKSGYAIWKDGVCIKDCPDYTSRDAVVLVILKQDLETQCEVYRQLFRDKFKHDTNTTVRFIVSLEEIFHKTAKDHCEALLRATGKWKD